MNPPQNGTLTLGADGHFVYTPSPNFAGADSFTYRASDGTLLSNLATAAITVSPIAPTTVALAASSDTGASATDRITNDSSPTFTGTTVAGLTIRLFAHARRLLGGTHGRRLHRGRRVGSLSSDLVAAGRRRLRVLRVGIPAG